MISKSLQPITTAQWKAKDQINRFRLRIVDETVDLESMSLDKLKVYYEYITIIGIGVPCVILLEALEASKKSAELIKLIKKIFDAPIQEYKLGLEGARQLYEINEAKLKNNGFCDGLYLEMMKPLLDYFEKNPKNNQVKSSSP